MSIAVNGLEWHKQALVNMRLSLAARQRAFEQSLVELTDLRTRVAFYGIQIDEAERMGKKAFDADHFMRSRERI
jgi:hypothetical protein